MKALDDYFKAEPGRLSRTAEVTGISPSFLSRVAAGHRQPKLDNLRAIAKATGLSLESLLTQPPKRKERVK